MSKSFSCHCEERKKPIRERRWVVLERNCHHSAFSGYRCTYSDYSEVYCKNCGAMGRTKAKYVDLLPDGKFEPGDPVEQEKEWYDED